MSSMASAADSKLDTDRYGVPQFAGEAELLEEYIDRCWDLYYGREGQDALQIATPLHLRAQLSGTAYEAVRRIEHTKLRTKTAEGKATDEGMQLLLNTLKDSLAQEAPVRAQELFLEYFYSPQVWRKNQETMAQYIVRRELAFTRLKEANSETALSDNLKCMLLLIFAGLDIKEQQSILASVGNEFNYKKVSQALRIQYPTLAQTRPVQRKDYLGAGRSSHQPSLRPRWKGYPKRQVFAAEMEDDEVHVEDEVFAEEGTENFEDDDDVFAAYSDDEALEALMNDIPEEEWEDESVAEAFATIAQHRGNFKKKFVKRPQQNSSGSSQTFGFKAHGDLTLDQKSKDQRRAAVSFLKSVTQCTACKQKGHWVGDSVCPLASKKGSGKGGKSKGNKPQSTPQKKQPPKVVKKPGSVLFVLHDKIESDDANEAHFMMKYDMAPAFALPPVDEHMPRNDMTLENDMALAYDMSHANDVVPANVKVFDYEHTPENVLPPEGVSVIDETYGKTSAPELNNTAETYGESTLSLSKSFTDTLQCHEVLMALRAPALCEHSVYRGGQERQFHRGANGHTRHITCKDCEKNVITARRKDPTQLWSYLVQLAMCTK